MKIILGAIFALALGSMVFAQMAQAMETMNTNMKGMNRTATTQAQGSGVVKKIDLKGGLVTLQHAPIPALKLPAMTMAFKAAPALLQKLKLGQKVKFTIASGTILEVIAIEPTNGP